MATGASFQYRSRRADRRTGLFVTVALMCVLARGLFAQTTASHDSKPPKSSKIPAALVDAEALMNQGLLDQAKDKIQEQLKLTPSSAEAYNLLGILYSNEKNYAKALEWFTKTGNRESLQIWMGNSANVASESGDYRTAATDGRKRGWHALAVVSVTLPFIAVVIAVAEFDNRHSVQSKIKT